MKKIFALVVSLAMTLSLCSCAEQAAPQQPAVQEPAQASSAVQEPSSPQADDVNWPTGPVTLSVGYSAGGSADTTARFMATELEEHLGVPVVVENNPGSSSWVAWTQLQNSTPKDGNTFTMINLGTMFGSYDEANPREFSLDDFEVLALQAVDYTVIAIRNDETRFTDFASMIEYGKTNELMVAGSSSGITSADGTLIKYLSDTYGCKITGIPVDGATDAKTMFLAGDVDFFTGNIGDVATGAANGEYNVCVVFADERSEFLPDTPTIGECGFEPLELYAVRGYAYAKGVDEKIVAKMQDAIAKAIEDEDCVANCNALGIGTKLYVGEEGREFLLDQLEWRAGVWGVDIK